MYGRIFLEENPAVFEVERENNPNKYLSGFCYGFGHEFWSNEDVNCQQKVSLLTRLHYACQFGEEDVVKFFLEEKNANVYEKKDANGNIVRDAHGNIVYLKDANGNTVLHYAAKCARDNPKIVKLISERAKSDGKGRELICAKNALEFTALKVAVEHNCINNVAALLEYYADYIIFSFDELLLNFAALKNHSRIITWLKLHGDVFDINEVNEDKKTALHYAAQSNNCELIEHLFSLGADATLKDDKGQNPLFVAVSCDNVEAFEKLFPFSEYRLEDVIAYAIQFNSSKIFELLLAEDGFSAAMPLIAYQRDIAFRTPLHFVAYHGNVKMYKEIIKYYTCIDLRDFLLQTPLHIAADREYDEIFRLMFEYSPSLIFVRDFYERNPLAVACEKNCIKIIKFVMCRTDAMSNPVTRREFLMSALWTKNIVLLKLLFNRLHYHGEVRRTVDIEVDHACFTETIKTGFSEGVSYLLNDPLWEIFMRRQDSGRKKSPMHFLIEKMPELAKIVCDKCIEKNQRGETWYTYEFLDDVNYSPEENGEDDCDEDESLVGDEAELTNIKIKLSFHEVIANNPLSFMIKNERHDLLFHPLVESYINLKWNKFAKWGSYALCIYYLVFVLLSTGALFNVKYVSPVVVDNATAANETMLNERAIKYECLISPFLGWTVYLFFGLCHVLFTSYKFIRDYNFQNRWLDFLVGFLLLCVGRPLCYIFDFELQWNGIIFLTFFAWFAMLNSLKNNPRFGVYILMVNDVLKSFLRFSPVFIMFLLPFVIVFHILLQDEKNAVSFFGTSVKSLVMMIGEFDYESTVASKTSIIVSLMFCMFVLMVTIFLMNLLVGLAVSDISKILERTAITRKILQIESIHHIEIIMPEYLRNKVWKNVCKNKIKKDEDKSCATGFCQYFKWVGLPKSAIMDEISQDETIIYFNKIENKITELKQKIDPCPEKDKNEKVDTFVILKRSPPSSPQPLLKVRLNEEMSCVPLL